MATVIKLSDAAVYFGTSGPVAVKLKTAALKGIYSAALRSKQILQTTEIQDADPPPVNKGVYRAGWQVEKLKNGAAYYNSVPYARYIEDGVPAMNVVMSQKAIMAIAEWARRKLGGLDEKQALNVAYAIMQNLKKRGIFKHGAGLKIMKKYNDRKLNEVIRREIDAEIDKVKF
jgi:hypothetical protein